MIEPVIAIAIAVVSGALILFHFIVYPVIVLTRARLTTDPHAARMGEEWSGEGMTPPLTVVIAAYNEERVLEAKLNNTLSLDYPADRLQIIVVSDGSDDRTHEIAKGFRERGVVAMHQPQRRGKTAALNRGVASARGEIIVFSDANNHFSPNALRKLVRHFVDPEVGGVCGLKSIRAAPAREASIGDGLYWRYESAIKVAESRVGSIPTADGEIFAVRACLYVPMPEEVINDDAEITFNLVGKGYRILYDTGAVSTEHASKSIRDDFYVKVRMIAGGIQTVHRHWRSLLPPTTWFAFSFVSHKLLRWMVPELLILLFLSTWLLAERPLFALLFVGQVGFYGLALLGWVRPGRGELPRLLYVPMYFGVMSLAALVGQVRFLTKPHQTSLWRRAAR